MNQVKSNGKVSFDFLVAISLKENASDNHDDILKWFLSMIRPIKHPDVYKYGQYNWSIVSSIKNDDYEDEYDDEDEVNTKEPINTMIILINTSSCTGRTCTNDDMLVIQEYHEPSMSADVIANSLSELPEVVSKIGVSGVSTKYMNHEWNDLISEHPNEYDVPGKGFMIHPMWNIWDGHNWNVVRERSFNFFDWEKPRY